MIFLYLSVGLPLGKPPEANMAMMPCRKVSKEYSMVFICNDVPVNEVFLLCLTYSIILQFYIAIFFIWYALMLYVKMRRMQGMFV